MICDECGATIGSYPCACGHNPKAAKPEQKKGKPCLLKACAHPGCTIMIRWAVGTVQGQPLCQWHIDGRAYYDEKDWPSGMPDPTMPWPWLTADERERRIRLSYWQQQFRTHVSKEPRYAKFR